MPILTEEMLIPFIKKYRLATYIENELGWAKHTLCGRSKPCISRRDEAYALIISHLNSGKIPIQWAAQFAKRFNSEPIGFHFPEPASPLSRKKQEIPITPDVKTDDFVGKSNNGEADLRQQQYQNLLKHRSIGLK